MSQYVSPEFRPSKAKDAVQRLQGVSREKLQIAELTQELISRAKVAINNGGWQEQGTISTFERGRIGSHREEPHTYKGTDFFDVAGSTCQVALREVSAGDGNYGIHTNVLVKQQGDEDENAEILAFFTSRDVFVPGADSLTLDVLNDIQDIIFEVELHQSDGS
jgi:hypothetical protein